MLNVFFKIANDINNNFDLSSKNYQQLSTKNSKIFEGNNVDLEAPMINGCNIYKALCKILIFPLILGSCFNMYTQSFLVLCEQYKITLGTKQTNVGNNPDKKNLVEFINTNWKSMIKTLKILLSRDVDESLTQMVLNIYQNMINLTGSLGLNQARDTFLMTLCQACVPNGKIHLSNIDFKKMRVCKN